MTHLKRLASQIFGQLPEDSEEARMVLHYLGELMEWANQRPLPKANLSVIHSIPPSKD